MSHFGKCFRERTGLSPGQYRETTFPRTFIYNYFQSKEEIFLALLKWEYDLWIEALEEAMEKAGIPYISPSVYSLVCSAAEKMLEQEAHHIKTNMVEIFAHLNTDLIFLPFAFPLKR